MTQLLEGLARSIAGAVAAGGPIDGKDIGVEIDGKAFRYWEDIELIRTLDAVSTFSFRAPFLPDSVDFWRTFAPGSYRDIVVEVLGSPALTGTMLTPAPDTTPGRAVVAVVGYGLPGALADHTLPFEAFPMQLDGLTLKSICERVAGHYGVEVDFEGEPPKVPEVALEPGDRGWDVLSDLCRQHGYLLRDTPAGRLRVFQPPASGAAVARFAEGERPIEGVGFRQRPQAYHSSVTGLKSAEHGEKRAGFADGASVTVPNPLWTAVRKRPLTVTIDDVETLQDLEKAVAARLGRMIGNAFTWSVTLPTWRTPGGALWDAGDFISLEAPCAYLRRPTSLLVRQAKLSKSSDTESADLELVFPGTFSGVAPEVAPWA